MLSFFPNFYRFFINHTSILFIIVALEQPIIIVVKIKKLQHTRKNISFSPMERNVFLALEFHFSPTD